MGGAFSMSRLAWGTGVPDGVYIFLSSWRKDGRQCLTKKSQRKTLTAAHRKKVLVLIEKNFFMDCIGILLDLDWSIVI